MTKRLNNIDIIKTLAVFDVFICHFCRTLEFYNIRGVKVFFPTNIFNVYTGTVGSALFFIVSGFLLEYHGYHDSSILCFYRRRFRKIYPMFWIATILWGGVTVLENILTGNRPQNIPWYRMIYTVLGVDNIAESYELTFKQVGEWFLGVIIILYLLYPLLSFLINKSGWFFAAIAAMAIGTGCFIIPGFYLPLGKEFMEGILLFSYGIFFARYIRKEAAFLTIGSALLTGVMSFWELPSDLSVMQVSAVGVSLYNILFFLCLRTRESKAMRFPQMVSKYCYPIFLVHHRIMFLTLYFLKNAAISRGWLWLLFVLEAAITLAGSWVLSKITDFILAEGKKHASKVQGS